eukprot:1761450-Rhodomonas_salina.1
MDGWEAELEEQERWKRGRQTCRSVIQMGGRERDSPAMKEGGQDVEREREQASEEQRVLGGPGQNRGREGERVRECEGESEMEGGSLGVVQHAREREHIMLISGPGTRAYTHSGRQNNPPHAIAALPAGITHKHTPRHRTLASAVLTAAACPRRAGLRAARGDGLGLCGEQRGGDPRGPGLHQGDDAAAHARVQRRLAHAHLPRQSALSSPFRTVAASTFLLRSHLRSVGLSLALLSLSSSPRSAV